MDPQAVKEKEGGTVRRVLVIGGKAVQPSPSGCGSEVDLAKEKLSASTACTSCPGCEAAKVIRDTVLANLRRKPELNPATL